MPFLEEAMDPSSSLSELGFCIFCLFAAGVFAGRFGQVVLELATCHGSFLGMISNQQGMQGRRV